MPNARLTYEEMMAGLLSKHDPDTAMSLAVGGDYEAMGETLRQLLESYGLRENHYLIDVGCGSGRLAYALSRSSYRETLRYLGIDIVPAMLQYAAAKCQQPSWRFEPAAELKIPEADGCADMLCFFSVFTHLMQEESFLYLREAARVLKQGGVIVASYLDINEPRHWKTFTGNVASAKTRQAKAMDIFLSPDFFAVWARQLGLTLLDEPERDCGQRVCLLQKR
ncbi:MAG: class I SAM-dependent methyltransferase [Chthoniobacterales bacterium]|nr:class I SAM-dependent methyltransferase [Chthoniobacterales bacterium]